MSEETHQPAAEPEEQQLCTSCVAPNQPSAHFCSRCGAPLSSFATIAPFESIFAEGYIYRQAAEHPRNLITVLGIWLIFGPVSLIGFGLIIISFSWLDPRPGMEMIPLLLGTAFFGFSAIMIARTTWNYWARKQADSKRRESS